MDFQIKHKASKALGFIRNRVADTICKHSYWLIAGMFAKGDNKVAEGCRWNTKTANPEKAKSEKGMGGNTEAQLPVM